MRAAAGSPSYQTLAARTHFSIATLSRAAAGNTLPSREVTAAFVTACGGDVSHWLAELERVRGLLSHYGRVPDAGRALSNPDPNLNLNLNPAPTPAPPPAARLAQLPADIGDFSGRAEQIGFLRSALTKDAGRPGQAAIAAVTGSGGVGKTSLAVAVAHQLAGRFPDGQLFVDLHGMGATPRDPADVLRGWLSELGTPTDAQPADAQPAGTDALAARFRSLLAGKRMLIVIDNAKDTAHLSRLLPATAGCAVLVTSRNRLAELPGGVRLDLEPLAEFDALTMLEEVVGAERLRAEPSATAQILHACAGLPLALRIAGARLRARPSWSVATLATRLADQNRRLDELRIGDLAVRTSFEVSLAALPPDADARPSPSHLFALLGLVTGPSISAAAAAALAGIDEDRAQETLETLVDSYLVQTSGPGRYHLHDLLRGFAAELAVRELSPEEQTAAVTRCLRWYIHAVAAAADHLPYRTPRALQRALPEIPAYGAIPAFDDLDAAKRWFRDERPNLLAAVTLADTALAGPEAHALALQTSEYLFAEMLWSDQAELCRIIEQRTRRIGDIAGNARALSTLAFALGRLHLQDEALDAGQRCVAAAEHLQDPRILNNAYTAYGAALVKADRPQEAASLIERALAISRGIGEPDLIAKDLINLGLILRQCAGPAEGDRHLTEAVQIARAADELYTLAYATNELGTSQRDQGNSREAVRLLAQAANLRRTIGDHTGRAESLLGLSSALLGLGHHADARAAWEEASLIVDDVDDAYLRRLRADLDATFTAQTSLFRSPG
ncbi:ATP-binding protein [Catenulispora pinisilvae]|uniref:ATP-binding protein n=1 Tax=Catenulispora pinisilvae TaxID=2705253 RepID=UPI001891B816|nr:tetratricopeptide repeat protein [Catenulispora pinisilvae]